MAGHFTRPSSAGRRAAPYRHQSTMSDEAYQTYDPHFRIQLVDRVAKETLVAANGKIWPIHTVPYSIETVETWPINPPIPETASPDHVTFTTLSTWVKEPTSPFPAH